MARRLAGLTQTEVAAEATIAQSHLNAIEKMQRLASPKMQRRILASIYALGLTMTLSEKRSGQTTVDRGTRRRRAMTPDRFGMLRRLGEMTDEEAEQFILSDNASDIALKRDIAHMIWRSELEEKQQRPRG